MQTKEDRIRRHYKTMKRVYYSNDMPVSAMWLAMARKWKMSVRDIKAIVRNSDAEV